MIMSGSRDTLGQHVDGMRSDRRLKRDLLQPFCREESFYGCLCPKTASRRQRIPPKERGMYRFRLYICIILPCLKKCIRIILIPHVSGASSLGLPVVLQTTAC